MVYPVFTNKFMLAVDGRAGVNNKGTGEAKYTGCDFQTVADMETFSVSIDTNVEEWTPMDTEGWVRRLATGKGFSISLSGKRNSGDKGNDYVANLRFATGDKLSSVLKWEMAEGGTLYVECVLNLTSTGGDSTNVYGLEFEAMSDGAPTFVPAPSEP